MYYTHVHCLCRHRILLFPGGSVVKNPSSNAGDMGSIPVFRKIPWRRKRQPPPIFLPGKCHGQRSLRAVVHGGHKESDTTEWPSTHAHTMSPGDNKETGNTGYFWEGNLEMGNRDERGNFQGHPFLTSWILRHTLIYSSNKYIIKTLK